MVISFEEKDRAAIEAKGMTIIEYKRVLYRIRVFHRIRNQYHALSDGVRCVLKAWNSFKKRLFEAVDSLKLLCEQIREVYHYPTSFRYKAVKFISKCTGIEKWRLWTMTRRIWLARSCC